MPELTKEQLTALTHLGARARLAELVAEEDAILRAYPDLGSRTPTARTNAGNGAAPAEEPATRRRAYRMSPAKRKAAGERMRAYWAAKRQAKESGETAASAPAAEPQKKARGARGRKGRTAKR